eukprot:746230-Hanusia_phi.AAC.4
MFQGLLSGEKAYKPIQEGKENGAQPVAVLDDLLRSGGDGKTFLDVCHEVLNSYPEVFWPCFTQTKTDIVCVKITSQVKEVKEETVVFSKEMHGNATTSDVKSDGKQVDEKKGSAIKRGALRSVKRTGLGGDRLLRV